MRCAEAVARGKQVWGVEEHIRYRLVLEAPAPIAGPVVAEGQSRFALGPLPEVAASTKTWAELGPGTSLQDQSATPWPRREWSVGKLSMSPSPICRRHSWPGSRRIRWPPTRRTRSRRPPRRYPTRPRSPCPTRLAIIGDTDSLAALGDLVEPWTDQSNGRSQAAAVEGDHLAAIAALGMKRARVATIDPGHGLAWMAWAAGSGGGTWAPPRRRCRSLSGLVGGGDAHRPGMAGRP